MKTPEKPKAKKSPDKSPQQKGIQPAQADAAAKKQQQPDPLASLNPRALALRLGIPILLAWIVAFAISGWIPKVVALVITLGLLGLALWVTRYVQRSRAVANIVRAADTPEARKEALEKLQTDFKKDDTAAVFARAQLELQEDPRKALATLESLKLDKLMAPVADEVRAQRGLIHLMLGETDDARALVDAIDLGRHKEPKTRATMAAITAEAWARTGQAKRAVEILDTFDPNDPAYEELKPQLLRARAFAYAWSNDTKRMKQALRALSSVNPQLLSGFITKKKHPMGVSPRGVHPLLEKEAYEMVVRSGAVSRKVEFRRG